MKRALAALVVVTVAVVAGVWWLRAPTGLSTQVRGSPQNRDANTAKVVTPGVPPNPTLAAGMNLQADYHFSLAAPSPLDLRVRGVLELGQPSVVDGATWVPARLTGATVAMSAALAKVLDLPADGHGLDGAWLLRREADGRVTEVRFDPQMPVAGQSVLAALAFGTQLRRPDQPTARTWQASEVDANGPYEARYERLTDGAVAKQWASGPARPGQRTDTTARYTADAKGLQQVQIDEHGTGSTGGLNSKQFVPMQLTIALVRSGTSDVRWSAGLKPDTLQAYTAATADVRWQRQAEPTRAFANVVADVQTKAATSDAGGRVNLRNELTRAIGSTPAAVAQTEQLLRARTLDVKAEAVVIAALVGARTREAQTAVAGLIKDPGLPDDLRMPVLQSAAMMSGPTPAFVATLASLTKLSEDPAYRGAVATTLGQSITFLAETHPTEALQQLATYLEQAQAVLAPADHGKPQPAGIRFAWLAGLGNTGSPEALPLLLGALKDPNELVRGAGVLALRRQDPAACIDALVDRMAHDPSVHVRENVMDVAQMMGPAVTAPMVKKALYLDDSAFVRSAAALAVSVWSADAPAMRAVLVDALKHEKSPEVAQRLQNFIEQGRVAGQPMQTNTKMGAHP